MFISEVDEPIIFVSFKSLTFLDMRSLLFVVLFCFMAVGFFCLAVLEFFKCCQPKQFESEQDKICRFRPCFFSLETIGSLRDLNV